MGKNRKKQQLVEQMQETNIQINIEDLYKELEVNHNTDQFVEKFAEYLTKMNK